MIKSILNVLMSKGIMLILSFFTMVILARSLGPENRGTFAVLMLLPNLFVSICEGGMRQSATYYIGQNKASLVTIVSSLRLFVITISLLSFGFLLLAQNYYLNNKVSLGVMVLSSCILPLVLNININRGILLGVERVKEFSSSLWRPKLVYLILISILYYMDSISIYTASVAYLIMFLFNYIQSNVYVRKHTPKTSFISVDLSLLKEMFKLGVVYSISYFFVDLNYKVGIFVANYTLDSYDIGIYAVNLQLVELVWHIPAAVSIVIFSKGSNQASSTKAWTEKIKMICRFQVILALLLCMSIVILGDEFFEVIFGSEYNGIVLIFSYMIPGIIAMSVFKIINVEFAAKGKPYESLKFMPVIVIFNIIASYFFSLHFGVIGLAISVVVSYVLAVLIICRKYIRLYDNGSKLNEYFLVNKSDINYVKKIR